MVNDESTLRFDRFKQAAKALVGLDFHILRLDRMAAFDVLPFALVKLWGNDTMYRGLMIAELWLRIIPSGSVFTIMPRFQNRLIHPKSNYEGSSGIFSGALKSPNPYVMI